MNSLMSSTWIWRILSAMLAVNAIPSLAHVLEPFFSTARIEARHAPVMSTPPPTNPVPQRRNAEDEATYYTVTYAPNSTCGYLSGSVQIPITCENNGRCLWELEYFKFIACSISGKTTGLARTKCLQKDEALDSNLCDDVCISNTYNLLCTNDTAQYCRTYAYPKGVRDYACASTPTTRVASVDFTYNEENPKFTISTYLDVDNPTSDTTTATATSSTATSSTTADSSSSTNGDDLSDGEIAGIVVASFVAGVVMMCLFIWCHRRQRKSNVAHIATDTPLQSVSPMTSTPPLWENWSPFGGRSGPRSGGSMAQSSDRGPVEPKLPPPQGQSEFMSGLGEQNMQERQAG